MASGPRTVEDIFKDYSARRTALIRALTHDFDQFFALCDPDKENLCLYGHSNETWEVAIPPENVPPNLPEPAIGINFARDGMKRKDWISYVAVHSDSWLFYMSFYLGYRLNRYQRKRLFSLINDLPTVFEVVISSIPNPVKPTRDSGSTKAPLNWEHYQVLCGCCAGSYNGDEFWIGCDTCEWWYHGKCVMITPAKAETMKQYKCPSCTLRRHNINIKTEKEDG